MSNLKTAIEDKNYLIAKLTNQIERLGVKKTRRIDKIERINEALADKRAAITDSEDATVVISKKFHDRNKRDTELLEKGIEKRNARLTRFETRLQNLTERVENYRLAVQNWTNKKIESNRIRAEKRAQAVKAVSVEGIKEFIDKKELYISVLEKRNAQADQLIADKTNFIEKIKVEIENIKNKPKTKIILKKIESEQAEQTIDKVIEPQDTIEELVSETINDEVEIVEPVEQSEVENLDEIIAEDEPESKEPEQETKVVTKEKTSKYFKPIQNLRNKNKK